MRIVGVDRSAACMVGVQMCGYSCGLSNCVGFLCASVFSPALSLCASGFSYLSRLVTWANATGSLVFDPACTL